MYEKNAEQMQEDYRYSWKEDPVVIIWHSLTDPDYFLNHIQTRGIQGSPGNGLYMYRII